MDSQCLSPGHLARAVTSLCTCIPPRLCPVGLLASIVFAVRNLFFHESALTTKLGFTVMGQVLVS